MPMITTGGNHPTELYFTDSGGNGRPVVLIHSWHGVASTLIAAGHRVVAYDRRGFGHSGKPADGYDYNTFAADLDALLVARDLRNVCLVGFSMGGGEVARYLGSRGDERVTAAAFIAAIPPCLDLGIDPDGGFTAEAAHEMQESLRANPVAFYREFVTNFYSTPAGLTVPQARVDKSVDIAELADIEAAATCIELWLTDFRDDVASIDVPVLVVHGDGDQIVPIEASGARMPRYANQSKLVTIPGGPHGLLASHTSEVATALVEFLG